MVMQPWVIAGAGGFLGRNLIRTLTQAGQPVVALSRQPIERMAGVTWHPWDGRTLGPWAESLDGAAAVVNLVGRSVDCVKTPAQRQEILESRVFSVRVLGQALQRCAQPPPVWVQAGSAHIHGDPMPPDTLVADDSPVGQGFAPEVCTAWEQALRESVLPGQRHVVLRTSFVLGADGGAMRRLIALTRWGLGGQIGDGKQWISWIHERDFTAVVLRCMQDVSYEGIYLVTAPEPVTNEVFMREMRLAWHRPWSPPAPAWAVRIGARFLLQTDPELALLGRRCVPRRLLNQGFAFAYPTLREALTEIAGRR